MRLWRCTRKEYGRLSLQKVCNYRQNSNSAIFLFPDKYMRWRNWVKSWADAFTRFFGTYIGVNSKVISITTITHFLQLILVWVWNIKKGIFNIRFKVPWPIVWESMVKFFIPSYQFFTKIVIKNTPWQNLRNFLGAILDKFAANLNNISLELAVISSVCK